MALIGTIAIKMQAELSAFTKGMQSAAKVVTNFGKTAAASVVGSESLIGKTGAAIGGVIKEFYIAPLAGFARYVGSWGKVLGGAISDKVIGPFKGFAKYLGNWGNALNAVFGDRVRALIGPLKAIGSVALQVGGVFGRLGLAAGKTLVGALELANRAVMSLAGMMMDAVKAGALMGVVLGGVALFALADVAKGAIALSEQTDRARVVFGQFAGLVTEEAQRMATAFGVSRKEFIAAASAFGTIFQGVGYTDSAAAQLSVHFTRLATDLSSLVHIPVAEAMEKIQSGLAGQVRPLREVGVFMSEERIEAYAAAHGIAKLGAELTETQKVQARVGFITEALAKAQGNLAATADGAGNTIRSLTGRFDNLKDSIGLSLLGFLVPLMEEVTVGIQAIQMAWERSGFAVDLASAGALSGVQKQATGIGWLQKTIMWLADGWQSVKVAAIGVLLDVNKAILNVMESLRGVIYQFDRMNDAGRKQKGYGPGVQMAEGFESALQKMQDIRTQMLKLQAAEKGAARPSIAIAVAWEEAQKEIGKARDDLKAEGVLDVNKLAPAAEAAKAAAAPKFANFATYKSQEGVNAQLRSRYGSQVAGKKPEEATAKNTEKTVSILQQMLEVSKRGGNAAEQGGVALGGLLGLF
jgi:hypothetical protein